VKNCGKSDWENNGQHTLGGFFTSEKQPFSVAKKYLPQQALIFLLNLGSCK
jgi:hypothetical protein